MQVRVTQLRLFTAVAKLDSGDQRLIKELFVACAELDQMGCFYTSGSSTACLNGTRICAQVLH
jgi:hypothetical protein